MRVTLFPPVSGFRMAYSALMKYLLIFTLFAHSLAFAKDIKKDVIGKKACAYSKTVTQEVCMREFREYCSSGKNTLEIITRACVYAVGGHEAMLCILGLINDSELIYEPTKSQLQDYLEYQRLKGIEVPRTKCHIEGNIKECLVREIGNFIDASDSFDTPLNLPRVIN